MRSSKSSSSRLTAVAVTSLPICRIISKVKKQTKQRRNRWRQTSGQICCLVIVLGFKRHRFDDLYRFNLEHFWSSFVKWKIKRQFQQRLKTTHLHSSAGCRNYDFWASRGSRDVTVLILNQSRLKWAAHFFLSWKSEAGSVILLVVFISLHPAHFRDDTASLALACS